MGLTHLPQRSLLRWHSSPMRMRVPICSNIVVKYFHCWLNPIFFKCFYLSERHRDTDTNILLMLLNPQLSPNCQEWAIMEPIQGTREADIPAPEPWSAASQGKHQQAVGIRSGGGTQHPRHSNMKSRHHKQHFNCCARGRPLMLSSHTEHFTSLLGGDTTASHIIPSFLAYAQWLCHDNTAEEKDQWDPLRIGLQPCSSGFQKRLVRYYFAFWNQ